MEHRQDGDYGTSHIEQFRELTRLWHRLMGNGQDDDDAEIDALEDELGVLWEGMTDEERQQLRQEGGW